MKKKLIMSAATAAAAAALIFTGAGASEAEAATCKTVKHVTYKTSYQVDSYKAWQQYIVKHHAGHHVQAQQPVQQEAAQQTQQQPSEQEQNTEEVTNESTGNVEEAPAESTEKETASASELSAYEQEVVDLTNEERAKQGLEPLTADAELSKVARAKSQDMKDNNYFDHNSPTYGSPFDMMKQFGISYTAAGENIAQGQKTPEEVVEAWMNSEGHRANILNSKFTHIGVGYVESGNYWTQQFITK